jgi:hypothetical protein
LKAVIQKTAPESDGMLWGVAFPAVEEVVLPGGDDYHASVIQPSD